MPKKNVMIFTKRESEWSDFLKEFFEDTYVRLEIISDFKEFAAFDQLKPDLLFTDDQEWRLSIKQKLKAYRQSHPNFRLILLGTNEKGIDAETSADAAFLAAPAFVQFLKDLVNILPLPKVVKVLIADDEVEIGHAIRDYLDHRVDPQFQIRYVENGKKALEAIEAEVPEVLILDIKMPVLTGQDVYREIKQRKLDIAVIVFFDAITGNEITELHKWGKPAIVDKGSQESSMPELMALVKKMAFFR